MRISTRMTMAMTGGSGTLGGCSLDWFTGQRMHPISETCFDSMMMTMMMTRMVMITMMVMITTMVMMMMVMILEWFTEQRVHPISEKCFDMTAMVMKIFKLKLSETLKH